MVLLRELPNQNNPSTIYSDTKCMGNVNLENAEEEETKHNSYQKFVHSKEKKNSLAKWELDFDHMSVKRD